MKFFIFSLIVLLCSSLVAFEAYLGIYVSLPSASELRKANLDFGIKIDTIMLGSPADIYGLRENDIIYKIDNLYIRNESDLQRFMGNSKPFTSVYVLLVRDNQPLIKQIQFSRRNALYQELYIYNYIQNPWLFIGIDVEPISFALARLLKLEKGMVILDVRENSIASIQGLEAGDIIISINDKETISEKSLTDAMNMGLQNQPMHFDIWRNSNRQIKLVDLSNSLIDNRNLSEVFIMGPDVFNNELYSYSKDMINRILKKSKSEIEYDIERLEQEIFNLRQRIDNEN